MTPRIDPFREIEAARPRWTWATTFHLDIPFVDDHLLRRLGERTELTILCDASWLSRHLAESRDDRLGRRAGQDYLLHPVAHGRLFHPKTYLLARPEGGVLLVGSGNLDLSGLARGHEHFIAFRSEVEAHRPSLAAWARWMQELVEARADRLLLSRFSELRAKCPWLVAPHAEGDFVDNRLRPLLDAFVDRVAGPVRELHLTAPFLDPEGATVAGVMERLQPAQTTLYLCRGASVDGAVLRASLSRTGMSVKILRYSESPFVHAKAIGAVTETGALVLSGSANLSSGALLRAWGKESGANIDAAHANLPTPAHRISPGEHQVAGRG
jgi:hypothetical protein